MASVPTTPTDPPQSGPADEVSTVSFVSLGCPKNLVDSEKMLGLLAEEGIAPISAGAAPDDASFDGADAVVINTCGFLEASKEESLSTIQSALDAKAAGQIKRVVVAGCLVQRHRAKLLDWAPGVDAMVGVFDRDKIIEAVRGEKPERATLAEASDQPKYWVAGNALQAAKDRGVQVTGLTVNGADGKGIGYFEDDSSRLRLTPRHYAYLRISEGCNQNCAFCTIPSIRGKMRSKPIERIASEARELIADGAFELSLIGQDTTSYGNDLGIGLDEDGNGGMPAMLRAVSNAFDEAGAPGWVRLMYAYPSNFSDEMIDAFAQLAADGHLVPYIDIPLQHASDRVLTAMRRNVSADHQRELLEKLRERIPGMAIRTTFITGFPGETEADHERLMELIDEVGFDAMGVFKYSTEEGTVAGRLASDPSLAVPSDVMDRRYDELMGLQQRIAFEQASFLAEQFDPSNPLDSGVQMEVLIDRVTGVEGQATPGVIDQGLLFEGRTYFQAPSVDAVTFVHASRPLSPGELVKCAIVGSDGYDLIARPLDELDTSVSLPVLR